MRRENAKRNIVDLFRALVQESAVSAGEVGHGSVDGVSEQEEEAGPAGVGVFVGVLERQ